MKKKNKISVLILIAGCIFGIAGSLLKIGWLPGADTMMLISLIMVVISLSGLLAVNAGRIQNTLFRAKK